MRRMALDGGPMKAMSQDSQTSAKWGFSERNPYPGCTASAFMISAALMMRGMFR